MGRETKFIETGTEFNPSSQTRIDSGKRKTLISKSFDVRNLNLSDSRRKVDSLTETFGNFSREENSKGGHNQSLVATKVKSSEKKEHHLKAALLADYKLYKKQIIKNPLKSATGNLLKEDGTAQSDKEKSSKPRVKPLFNVRRLNIVDPLGEGYAPLTAKEVRNSQPKEQYMPISARVGLQVSSTNRGFSEKKEKKLTIIFDRSPPKSRAGSRHLSSRSKRDLNKSTITPNLSSLEVSKTNQKVHDSSSKRLVFAKRMKGATPLSKVLSQLDMDGEQESSAKEPESRTMIQQKLASMSRANFSSVVSVMDPKAKAAVEVWEKYKVTKGVSTYLHVVDGELDQKTETYETFRQRNWQRWGDFIDLLKSTKEYFKEYNKTTFKLNCFEMESLLDIGNFYPGFPTEAQLRSLFSADLIFALEADRKQVEVKDASRKTHDPKFSFLRSVFIIQRYLKKTLARRFLRKLQRTKKMLQYIAKKLFVRAKYTKTKKLIGMILSNYRESYKLLNNKFTEIWPSLTKKQRVEIHLNSLGYDFAVREGLRYFEEMQSDQIQRLARLRDNSLSIIFVTFDGVPHSSILYHAKLLEELGVRNILSRIKFVKLVDSVQ